ncbi:MAG: VPLPA-CTERM sorting domain-containing protein [Candidatus Thiodiazotropha sp.]
MSHGTHCLLAAAVITFGTVGTASAAAYSSSDFTLSWTLSSVQFANNTSVDYTSDLELDTEGYSNLNHQQLWGAGTGSTSGFGSVQSDGTPAAGPYGMFPFSTGTSVDTNLNASASASGTGSSYDGETLGSTEFSVQSYSEEQLFFTFDYNWSRDVTLSNSVDGERSTAFLDVVAQLNGTDQDGNDFLLTDHLIDGNTADFNHGANIGSSLLTDWNYTDSGSGSLVLTLLPYAYGLISFDATVGARAEVNPVPLPAAAWLFGSGLLALLGVTGRRKSSGV